MSIALAHNNEVSVDYKPASALVSGKTMVERKVSVLASASFEATTYLAAQKGKVGIMARHAMAGFSVQAIASAARRGNYQPLAEAIAGITGESLTISNRSAFESLADRFEDKLNDLGLSKSGGWAIDKKTGLQKPNAKRATLGQVINLVNSVRDLAATL
jgi:hypothetical protein